MNVTSKEVIRSGLRLIAVLGLAIGLAACGGGGSSSSGSSASTVPTTPVSITTSNQNAVAGAAIGTMTGGISAYGMGVQTSGTAASAVGAALEINKISRAAVQRLQNATAMVVGTQYSVPCNYSGTATETINDSTGAITITFSSCVDTIGETVNGSIAMSALTTTSTTMSYTMTFNVTISCSCSDAGSIVGDMTYTGNISTGAYTISGTSLTVTDSTGAHSLRNYSITCDVSGNMTSVTYTVASANISGSVTVAMTTPITYGSGTYPNGGVLTITGANSTVLKVTILGDETAAANSQVELQLSTNGGTTWGTPVYVTWATLASYF